MRKFKFAPWALATLLAVALTGVHSVRAASGSPAVKLLNAKLPSEVTLSSATVAQTANALAAAAAEKPDMAATLTQAAITAKTPKPGHGEISCASVTKLANAAIGAAPQKSNDILQMALSMHPECADALNALASNPNGNAPDGYHDPEDLYGGFGVGFGPGFPGSPGFVGSPPSGAIALPPVATTDVVNS